MLPHAERLCDGLSSSQNLHRPKPQRFNVEFSNLEVAKEDLVEVFGNQLKP
jgi:hypothetical protein